MRIDIRAAWAVHFGQIPALGTMLRSMEGQEFGLLEGPGEPARMIARFFRATGFSLALGNVCSGRHIRGAINRNARRLATPTRWWPGAWR